MRRLARPIVLRAACTYLGAPLPLSWSGLPPPATTAAAAAVASVAVAVADGAAVAASSIIAETSAVQRARRGPQRRAHASKVV